MSFHANITEKGWRNFVHTVPGHCADKIVKIHHSKWMDRRMNALLGYGARYYGAQGGYYRIAFDTEEQCVFFKLKFE